MAKLYTLLLLVLSVKLSNSFDNCHGLNVPCEEDNSTSSNITVYNATSSKLLLDSKQLNLTTFTNLSSHQLNPNKKLTNFSSSDSLKFLNLSSNQISSRNLTNQHNLITLDLSNNSINNLSNIQLPNTLQNLNLSHNNIKISRNVTFPVNLTQLDMSNNGLTLQAGIYFTGSLKKIDLRNNNLHSIESITALTELEELYLSINNITELNNTLLSRLSSLVVLDLSRNRIANITRKTFLGLNHLQKLDMSDNLLLDVEPGTFQFMDNLIDLNLRGNNMIGRFVTDPNSMLIETGQRLQTIDVTGTSIKHIPVILSRSVRKLYSARNGIVMIQCGDLDSYPLVQVLNLSSNAISVIDDDALGRLEFLTELYLTNNSLQFIPRVLPDNLKLLYINGNKIKSLTSTDFTGLSKLKELDLSCNSIETIDDETFGQLTSLENIDLSGNPIKSLLSNTFIGPRRLRHLTLTRLNDLLPIEEPLSFPVPESGYLESLNLAWSPVLAHQLLDDVAALTTFRQLSELNLSGTNVTEIRSDLFRFLHRLRKLNLDDNALNCTNIIWLSKWFRENNKDNEILLQSVLDEDEYKQKSLKSESMRVATTTEPICFYPGRLKGISLFNLTENDFPEMSFTEEIQAEKTISTSTTETYTFTSTESATKTTNVFTTESATVEISIKRTTIEQRTPKDGNKKESIIIKENKTHIDNQYSSLTTIKNLFLIPKHNVINTNKSSIHIKNTSNTDNQFKKNLHKNTSVLVISNETIRIAGKTDAFSSLPNSSSHPGMLVFFIVLCVLVFASVIMVFSHWTQYRKRKELTRGYVPQQDIEVLSLSSTGVNDLW